MAIMGTRKDRAKELRAKGFKKETVSAFDCFRAKEYEMVQVAVMDFAEDKEGIIVLSGPCSIANAMAVTIQGAIEVMREELIFFMRGFNNCAESKVYVSDAINSIEEDTKYIVATVVSTDGDRHVEEFMVAPVAKLEDKRVTDVELEL